MDNLMVNEQNPPFLGYGLGLRSEHYEDIMLHRPKVDWFEIITENFLVPGGKHLSYLDKIREHYPLVMHGVSLSIGSADPLDKTYLQQVDELARRVNPVWVSDHLCWTGVNGLNTHDLLPLPYTTELVDYIVSRLHQVQDILKRPLLIENISSYLGFQQSHLTEWQFVSEIITQSGCYLLLDVNNVYVNAVNHGFNPRDYLNAIPLNRVAQIHLAGHSKEDNYLIDTHDAPVSPEVWALYQLVIEQLGPVSTMIERDKSIPPLAELLSELSYARKIADQVHLKELV